MSDLNRDQLVESVREFVDCRVAAGFVEPSGIAESVVEVFCDDADPELLRPLADRLVQEAVTAQLEAQTTWPDETDCDRLDQAMTILTQSGIVCRQNFSCCGNCGTAEIGAEMDDEESAGTVARGYAFYHQQDTEAATRGYGIFLNYGATDLGREAVIAVAREIVEVIQSHGLDATWNGQIDTRIKVNLDWKRRIAPC